MGLQLATEADSLKYFPASNSSREVRDRMLAACLRLGVRVQCKAHVTGISRDAESAAWRLRLEDGSEHCSARIASPCSQAAHQLCMLCTFTCILLMPPEDRLSQDFHNSGLCSSVCLQRVVTAAPATRV